MYYRLLRNDILKSKAITLVTMMFVAAAAMLVALAAILVVNLGGAIDTMMTQGKTPHFMQMHAGEVDLVRLAAFADHNEDVADFQVIEFLNVEGAQFEFADGSLAGSIQDNGLVVQSEKFDFLMDLDGNRITVADGEIYLPIVYLQDGTAGVGDTVTVAGKILTIAGPLRDSQMQPMLASSKRFLVSHKDFAALRQSGRVEYLIQFRLHDLDRLSAFGTAYSAAGLEANGPTITYPLFRMMNAISDGLMIAVILLVSALVLAIAFLCIRFTLLAKIEDDYREIGVMKAIGLRVSDIKKIYLTRYVAIAAVGSLLGYGLSFLFRDALLANIRLYMGESSNTALAPLLGIISVLLVFLTISFYVNGVLGRFRKISPAEAVRFGISQEKSGGGRRFRLSVNRLLGTNVFLGVKDVLARKSLYATMLAVLTLATFIIIVPQNLHNTIASKSFITYMGVGKSDLRVDIQQTDRIAEKTAEIAAAMADDASISRFVVLTTKTFRLQLADGSEENLKVELGDHSVFPLTYIKGRAPAAESEIALSMMNAREMDTRVGDVITLIIDGRKRMLTVCGTYSDVTHGGKSAKAVFAGDSADIMWSIITAGLADPAQVVETTARYSGRFAFAKVSDIDEFVRQTFGGTIDAIGKAASAAVAVALILTALITLLFMRMLVAKDRYAIAVMKAFGFTNRDIKAQYVARSVFVLIIGILLGTVLANTIGEVLAGMVIGSFGAASFTFIVNSGFACLLSPLLMAGAALAATIFGTLDAGYITISDNIKE
ncbi:MAG: ABC transporter permease [Spirochaetia bacterium]|nr:ABC transporter permease [Spirochaetia bacterium]